MDKSDKSEIISRRAFFRKTISKGLPFLVGIYAPHLFTSCKENYELESALASGCVDCSSTCKGSATTTSSGCNESSCSSSCSANCKDSSNNSSSGCTGSSCSTQCVSGCNTACKDICKDECQGQTRVTCHTCTSSCRQSCSSACDSSCTGSCRT